MSQLCTATLEQRRRAGIESVDPGNDTEGERERGVDCNHMSRIFYYYSKILDGFLILPSVLRILKIGISILSISEGPQVIV